MTAQTLDLLALSLRGVHLIEASAGTGKTYTIASLYLRMLLESGWSVQQILVVTFTKAATAELRGRIRERIRCALEILEQDAVGSGQQAKSDELLLALLRPYRSDKTAAQRLRDALICMDEAAIFTIHGVCQRLLQEHAFESGVLFETEFVGNQGDLLASVVEDFWRRTFYPGTSGLARLAQQAWGAPSGLLQEIRPELARENVEVRPEVAESEVSSTAYRRLLGHVRGLWLTQGQAVVEGLQQRAEHKLISQNAATYKPALLEHAVAALSDYLDGEIDDYFLPEGFALFTSTCFSNARSKKGIAADVQPPVPEFFERCEAMRVLCRNKLIQLRAAAFQYCREALDALKISRKQLSYDDLIQRLHASLLGSGGGALAESIAGQFPIAMIDEFQDTDPGQYGIFHKVYHGRRDCALFMIGDPKQAIYSFRGGDIFTYMQARRATESHFTLATNWRSTERYMRAVNALFSQRRKPFIYASDIPYHDVAAAPNGESQRNPYTVNGKAPAPFCTWFVRRAPDNTHQGTVTKGWARDAIAEATATEIGRLLNPKQVVRIGRRPVEPKDIAVLVRTHREGALIQQALQGQGIPSVYRGRSSIYATSEAAELAWILAAVASPQDDRALRLALATELLGKTSDWLASDDDERWDRIFHCFRSYHETWQQHGFIVMFRRLLHEQGVPERVMAYPDGERRLTNVLHLGELAQAASQVEPGMQGLLRWFTEARLRSDEDSEEQQLRLESDAERVQIVTVHQSKGLEYAIVFLPFCWDSRPKDAKAPFSYHDEDQPGMPLIFDLAAQDDHLPQADKERLAEELRLLYVGTTRAKYRCYLAWGLMNGAKNSALGYLLHQQPSMREPASEVPSRISGASDEALWDDLVSLGERGTLFEVLELPVERGPVAGSVDVSTPGLAARRFDGLIDTSWRISSFTGLAAAGQPASSAVEPDYDRADALDGGALDEAPPDPNSIFAFPKGARAGIFLHELFEVLDFPSASGAALTDTAIRLLRKHGYEQSRWLPAVAMLVDEVLDAVLDVETGVHLRSVGGSRRLNELPFYFSLGRLRAAGLNQALSRDRPEPDEAARFSFAETRGVMQGFIDLVFEHGGRYYVLDYKSNHLGNSLRDYASDRLSPIMRAHHYDLQYLIYTVAVHRYLRQRLPGYAYGEHYGGVYYLFLRGIRASEGAAFGVFHCKPEERLIDRLDALFGGDYP